jgi:gliding motility-associated-like protein
MITDKKQCASTQLEQVRVRVAQNPIKTIYPLRTICNNISLPIDVGYSVNSTINVSKIEFKNEATATNWVRTFIPDGPNCPQLGNCYRAPVTFNQFPSGKKLESKEDICSICVNMEHEYMGDISIAIVCPNGNQAMLKAQPSGTCGGGGSKFMGLPYGGNSHHTWDPTNHVCDSIYNPFGVGWNYCWSLNSDYDNSRGCVNNGPNVQVTHNFNTMPTGFISTSGVAGIQTFSTTDSSDYANKSGYYVPTDDFSTLVGCPLNGQWAIEICDQWGSDNGWVYSWSMDLCNIQISDCEYQVGIDTIIWSPSEGVKMDILTGSQARIYTPDSAGTFPVGIRIVDEFGCIWDTNTTITTVWNPQPKLGPDRTICDVEQVRLDAGDAHSHLPTYSFMWEPTFDTTQVIVTPAFTGQTTTYEVEVTNHDEGIYCRTRDTVVIEVSPQPTANFETNVYPIEGCSPFILKVDNTSMNATHYRWEFGDGIISTERSPQHVYAAGEYRLRLYAITDNGCQDSLIYPGLVRVFDSPEAEFGWNPAFPRVQEPTVKLKNKTTPDLPDNRYLWEIQYDKNENITVTTLDAKDTSYTWEGDIDELPGLYKVKLIAFANISSPTGNIVECRDTVEHTIQIVNDFLQFPNTVTPNGDGINDVFEIKNLIDGGGFPIFELSIYDAMGKRLYYKKNISDPSEFWDPSEVPTGTYFYHFIGKGHNGDVQRSGAIQVLR